MAQSLSAAIPDDFVRYQVAIAPIYQCLRRLLVQLAGLAILAKGGRQKDWREHPTLAAASQSLDEAEQSILITVPPGGMSEIHESLVRCAADLRWTLGCIGEVGARVTAESRDLDVTTRLDRAYRALRDAANEQLGFRLIDMRLACCCLQPGCTGSDQHSN